MVSRSVDTPAAGIQRALRRHTRKQAICEYIWNGFDAEATVVEVSLVKNKLGRITELRICDNGTGIPYETLNETFAPFFLSDRLRQVEDKRRQSAIQGEDGVGRFTFFHFAGKAEWETVFADREDNRYRYSITIHEDSLDEFAPTSRTMTDVDTGTKVLFTSIKPSKKENLERELLDYFAKQYAWFLELNRARGFKIMVDGEALDYRGLIAESVESPHSAIDDGRKYEFAIRIVLWHSKPTNEDSTYYFVRSDFTERYKTPTAYSKTGDRFYHSVYITSEFFDNSEELDFEAVFSRGREVSYFEEYRTLRELKDHIDSILEEKHRLFLKQSVERLMEHYRSREVFPEFGMSKYDALRKSDLEEVVRQLYLVRPRLFLELRLDQQKTLVRLLHLALDENVRESLFDILKDILDLSTSEMSNFAQLLKLARLKNVRRTLELIKDRFATVAALKRIVFDNELNSYESHIQDMIENHYWLFGEEYHLISAAEPNFVEALRRYRYELYGEEQSLSIEHPDRLGEMDVFAVRQIKDLNHRRIENIVIELKRPSVRLGEKELSQVKKYMRVILSKDEFNADNAIWRFYLVGNKYDTSKYIEGELESNLGHGEASLVHSLDSGRVRIYVKKWSDVFNEFELRHTFLQRELQLEQEHLIDERLDADELVKAHAHNTAGGPRAPEDR